MTPPSEWSFKWIRSRLLAELNVDAVGNTRLKQVLFMESVAILRDYDVVSPSCQVLLRSDQLSNCGGRVNLDVVELVGALDIELDVSGKRVAWCDPSIEGKCFQATLKGFDGKLGVDVGVAPMVMLKSRQDVSLNPQHLQWGSNLSQEAQCGSWWHWKVKCWWHGTQHGSFLMMKVTMSSSDCGDQSKSTCSALSESSQAEGLSAATGARTVDMSPRMQNCWGLIIWS